MLIPTGFKPMLAKDATWADYQRIFDDGQALLVSPKLDGIRCMVMEGRALSRTLKNIPNLYIQRQLSSPIYEALDGELIVGAAAGEGVFARAMSGVMSQGGSPDFSYHVFDDIELRGVPFGERINYLQSRKQTLCENSHGRIKVVPQAIVESLKQLEEVEQRFVDEGYEGCICRSVVGPYKFGRSTLRERYMLKLKRFEDGEATILGFQEKMINANEATRDARGYQVRGYSKEGKIPADTLGALLVQDTKKPEWEFSCGSGIDDSLGREIWFNQHKYINKIIKYRYFPVGTLELPRQPTFQGFRDPEDL